MHCMPCTILMLNISPSMRRFRELAGWITQKLFNWLSSLIELLCYFVCVTWQLLNCVDPLSIVSLTEGLNLMIAGHGKKVGKLCSDEEILMTTVLTPLLMFPNLFSAHWLVSPNTALLLCAPVYPWVLARHRTLITWNWYGLCENTQNCQAQGYFLTSLYLFLILKPWF